MVKLNKIYTKSGDKGTTGLGDASRRRKDDLRVAAYGTVDEANAMLGLARLHAGGDVDSLLARVQNDLFDMGADLCCPYGAAEESKLRIVAAQSEALERDIDYYNADLAPLNSFILPAGSAPAVHLHVARVVVRRAERLCVGLAQAEDVNPQVLVYLNRLSDLLFVLARHVDKGREVLWQAGQFR